MAYKETCSSLRVVIELDPNIKYLWEPDNLRSRLLESAQELVHPVATVARAITNHVNSVHAEISMVKECEHCGMEWEEGACCDKELQEYDAIRVVKRGK